jgi:hypothetical protein
LLDSYSGGFLRQFRVSSEELSGLPVLSDLMLKNKEYPTRQLNEFFSNYEVLQQKKQSDIATDKDLEKLTGIKGFYSYYTKMSKNLEQAKKEGNDKELSDYILEIKNTLKDYGYE